MFLLNLSTKLSEITYLSKIKMIEDDLKQVIEEYYSTVNMSRKMQLENVLTDFKRNPLSIDLAKQMIVEVGNSSMIKFYFLSVLECQELWDRTKFGADLVATNRQFLWTLLTENLLPDGSRVLI